jgi:hypothetical protein
MRHQRARRRVDIHAMGAEDEITFNDLLAGEPATAVMPQSWAQLLAEGFPRGGGLAALDAIQNLADPDSRSVSLRNSYQQILDLQRRAAR